jgi:hypothetical protein
MTADRYVKIILTIIAIELGWLALTQHATPVAAQAQQAATPVVLTGIDLVDRRDFLPVGVLGQVRGAARPDFTTLDTTVRNEPLRVSVPLPLDVRTVSPIRIDSDRPIKVENVGYTPAPRPGE